MLSYAGLMICGWLCFYLVLCLLGGGQNYLFAGSCDAGCCAVSDWAA
ncbi:MAG: hypothetical protein LBT09_16000 [Planctomycetaceae bacterium]|jgi:hypothetical protein|nr:hypothetical protein [Planctomycetaceae bacterium]